MVRQVVAELKVAVDAVKSNNRVVEIDGIYRKYPSSPWNHSSRKIDEADQVMNRPVTLEDKVANEDDNELIRT